MIRLTLFALFLASPAAAQEVNLDRNVVTGCFASAETGEITPPCIGAATNRCIDTTPKGGSTAEMSSCAAAETAIWDEILNATYQDLRAQMREMDADEFTGDVSRAEALRDAQRAWIAYRDAECNFEWAMFQEGTIRSLVAASCVQHMTARRALELRVHMEMPG